MNQVEIYFSIVQRKCLMPNDFPSVKVLAKQLIAFTERYNLTARPFNWRFTRADLLERLKLVS